MAFPSPLKFILCGACAALLAAGLVWESTTLLAQQREIARLQRLLAAPPPPAPAPAVSESSGTAESPASTHGAPAMGPETIAAETAWIEELGRRVSRLKDFLAENPQHRIPEMEVLTPDDWISVVRIAEPKSARPLRQLFAQLRVRAKARVFEEIWRKTLRELIEQRGGEIPTSLAEIDRLLANPLHHTTLARFELVAQGNVSDLEEREPILREKTSGLVDPEYDLVIHQAWRYSYQQGVRDYTSRNDTEKRLQTLAHLASVAFSQANGGRTISKREDLLPYFRDPKDADAYREYLARRRKLENATAP